MTAEASFAVRIAVVDDDTIVRDGLKQLLPRHQVSHTFERPESLLAAKPDVDLVLLDLNLAGAGHRNVRHGATAVRDVSSAGYQVLIYTNEYRRVVLAECLAAGGCGIVHKTESLEALAEAVERVRRGDVLITPALVGLAEVVERRGELPSLTPRQRQVLAGRARGRTWRLIARDLGISEKTANEHMSDVNAKFAEYLRTHSVTDLERHLGVGVGDLLGPLDGQ